MEIAQLLVVAYHLLPKSWKIMEVIAVKPGHSQKDHKLVFKTNYHLMQV